jgi:hypothetical protein
VRRNDAGVIAVVAALALLAAPSLAAASASGRGDTGRADDHRAHKDTIVVGGHPSPSTVFGRWEVDILNRLMNEKSERVISSLKANALDLKPQPGAAVIADTRTDLDWLSSVVRADQRVRCRHERTAFPDFFRYIKASEPVPGQDPAAPLLVGGQGVTAPEADAILNPRR